MKWEPSPWRGVVFDLDGTLLDTRAAMLGSINMTLRDLGRPRLTTRDLHSSTHAGLQSMLQRALVLTGALPGAEEYEQLDRVVSARYLASARERVVMFPALLPLLDSLRGRGTWMAICTNQLEAHARTLLAQFDLDAYFKEVVGRNTFAVHKPNPVPLAWLAGRCGVKPHEMLMIGDSEVDAQSAVHAGTGLVLMEHGYGDGRAISKYPRCPDFTKLNERLRGIPGQSIEKTSLAM